MKTVKRHVLVLTPAEYGILRSLLGGLSSMDGKEVQQAIGYARWSTLDSLLEKMDRVYTPKKLLEKE